MPEPLSDVWTQVAEAVGAIPTVTYPAVPGVGWELIAVHGETVTAAAVGINATVLIGGVIYGWLELPAVAQSKDTFDLAAPVLFAPGAGFTVTINVVPNASIGVALTAQARPR